MNGFKVMGIFNFENFVLEIEVASLIAKDYTDAEQIVKEQGVGEVYFESESQSIIYDFHNNKKNIFDSCKKNIPFQMLFNILLNKTDKTNEMIIPFKKVEYQILEY
ncbi:hypothetical protein V7024_23895 [Bacillus sp. JJ864]|uniref:hypothetical protein n=1 Tax=Bacillus sp. JJ864 TaxID=3122975 RepID=UPI002FFEBE82